MPAHLTVPASHAMVGAELLKQFAKGYDIIQAGLATALRGVEALDAIRLNQVTEKRTRKIRLAVGVELVRIHQTGSWRDRYKSWTLFCRSFNNPRLPRKISYVLMDEAAIHSKLDPEFLKLFPDGFTQREFQVLGQAEPEERDEAIEDAVATGDAAAPMSKLRESLRAAPVAEVDVGVAPKKPKENGVAYIKRVTTSLTNHFLADGNLEEAQQYFNAAGLIALEERTAAKKLADVA